jgi:hypothetical protein
MLGTLRTLGTILVEAQTRVNVIILQIFKNPTIDRTSVGIAMRAGMNRRALLESMGTLLIRPA